MKYDWRWWWHGTLIAILFPFCFVFVSILVVACALAEKIMEVKSRITQRFSVRIDNPQPPFPNWVRDADFVEFRPQSRTIRVEDESGTDTVFLRFPYLQFYRFRRPGEKDSIYVTCSKEPATKGSDKVYALPLPNLQGAMCIQYRSGFLDDDENLYNFADINDAISFFWQSTFTYDETAADYGYSKHDLHYWRKCDDVLANFDEIFHDRNVSPVLKLIWKYKEYETKVGNGTTNDGYNQDNLREVS